jgi:hypothetical protein
VRKIESYLSGKGRKREKEREREREGGERYEVTCLTTNAIGRQVESRAYEGFLAQVTLVERTLSLDIFAFFCPPLRKKLERKKKTCFFICFYSFLNDIFVK